MYPIERLSHCEFVPIRHLRYHVRQWGNPQPGATPWVMVHGWMDVSASFQFAVDALHTLGLDPWIIAPDWRGFGLTETPHQDSFWFADYLADLDFLLDHYCPDQAVNLIGHSMGGHVATLYAGARPQRIARLVNLEGFGMPATRPAQAPKRHAQWMDELHSQHRGELTLRAYPTLAGVAERLMKTNPRLSADKAQWLAQHWARQAEDGSWHILGHSGHKVVNPQLFQVDETLASYANITAPTLCVVAQDDSMSQWWKDRYTLEEFLQRYQLVPNLKHTRMQDCGHMLHHDQPQALALLLKDFLTQDASGQS
jgi:pimeloyl-ACP methyl ester carboxylesterase